MPSAPVRRRRGKSPRQVAFFVRNARAQFESSLLASVFACRSGSTRRQPARRASMLGDRDRLDRIRPPVLRRVRNASAVAVQRRHLVRARVVSAAAADAQRDLHAVRCRHCDSQYLRDRVNVCRRLLSRVHAEANSRERGTTLSKLARMALPRSRPNVSGWTVSRTRRALAQGRRAPARGARRSGDAVRAGLAGAQLHRGLVGQGDFRPTSRPARRRSRSSTPASFILLGEFRGHCRVRRGARRRSAARSCGSGAEFSRPAHDRRRTAGRRGRAARLRAGDGPLARDPSLLRPLRLADDRRARRSCAAM